MRSLAPLALATLVLSPVSIVAQKPEIVLDSGPVGAGFVGAPSIVADGEHVHVAWDENRNTLDAIYYSRSVDGGSTWLPDVPLSVSTLDLQTFEPELAVSGSTVCAVWTDRLNNVVDVRFNRSSDGGQTWLPTPLRVSSAPPGGPNAFAPEIHVDGSTVHVVWADERAGQSQIFVRTSLDGGVNWTGPEQAIGTGRFPELAVVGSTLYVVWYDFNDIYFGRSLDNGVMWSTPVQVDDDATNQVLLPQIAASGSNVYCCWTDSGGGNSFILFDRSTDGGVTWNVDRQVTPQITIVGSGSPMVAAVGDVVYLAWNDARHFGLSDIYFNRSLDQGATFLPQDIRLNSDLPGFEPAWITDLVAQDSHVHAVWYDRRATFLAGRPHYNRSTDFGATWLAEDIPIGPGGATFGAVSTRLAFIGSSIGAVWSQGGTVSVEDLVFSILSGAQSFGFGTPGTGGAVPELAEQGLQMLGQVTTLDVTNALSSSPAAMLLGLGVDSQVSVPLLGGTLLVTPQFALPFPVGAGTASLPIAIPDDPAFGGANLNFQAWVLDAAAPGGFAMTNGLEVWVN